MGVAAGESVAHLGHSVSRIGALASDGAGAVAQVASGLADAAGAVPRSVMAVAKERKVRDCLLQALCYASSPLAARQRRR